MGRAKRSVLTIHRKIEKDLLKTAEANAPGGRYHKVTIAEQLRSVRDRAAGNKMLR